MIAAGLRRRQRSLGPGWPRRAASGGISSPDQADGRGHRTGEALVGRDIITGLIKSVMFGFVITQIGCYEGFTVSGGPEGVGKSTTESVVTSIFMVVLVDMVFTALFYFIG